MLKIPPMPINEICKHLNITRETFFKWLNKEELLDEFYIHNSATRGELTNPFSYSTPLLRISAIMSNNFNN